MKKIMILALIVLGMMSCQKEEVDPTPSTPVPTYQSKYFRSEASKMTGNESITINGVTTRIGSLTMTEWFKEVSMNLPSGIRLEHLQYDMIAVSGTMTYTTSGYVWIGNY